LATTIVDGIPGPSRDLIRRDENSDQTVTWLRAEEGSDVDEFEADFVPLRDYGCGRDSGGKSLPFQHQKLRTRAEAYSSFPVISKIRAEISHRLLVRVGCIDVLQDSA
jgi:hypothetical protein